MDGDFHSSPISIVNQDNKNRTLIQPYRHQAIALFELPLHPL